MSRPNLKKEELESLFIGINTLGPIKTYNTIKDKALLLIDKKDSVDEDMLDMSEAILKMVREDEDMEDKKKAIYYLAASMLRKLAHELRITYIKKGKTTNSKDDRFIRLVSYNKDILSI